MPIEPQLSFIFISSHSCAGALQQHFSTPCMLLCVRLGPSYAKTHIVYSSLTRYLFTLLVWNVQFLRHLIQLFSPLSVSSLFFILNFYGAWFFYPHSRAKIACTNGFPYSHNQQTFKLLLPSCTRFILFIQHFPFSCFLYIHLLFSSASSISTCYKKHCVLAKVFHKLSASFTSVVISVQHPKLMQTNSLIIHFFTPSRFSENLFMNVYINSFIKF